MTDKELISEFLDVITKIQWSDGNDYGNSCPICGEDEYVLRDAHIGANSGFIPGQHKKDCKLLKLINEAKERLAIKVPKFDEPYMCPGCNSTNTTITYTDTTVDLKCHNCSEIYCLYDDTDMSNM